MKKLTLPKILFFGFLIRLVVAPLAEHGDVINYYWWSKDLLGRGLLGFYERSIANAMPPTYPPITSYIFWASSYLHEFIWNISWFLNTRVPVFPSNFIFWLESAKGWYFVNKLPAITADLGIIILLYKFTSTLKGKKSGVLASFLFAVSPPFWYNSGLWGQTDSLFALPMLASFYFLHKDRRIASSIFYLISVMTKPTAFFVLPVYAYWWVRRANYKDFYYSALVAFGAAVLLYLPFHPEGVLGFIFRFYKGSLGGELNYIVANAFNFWALVHGFENVPEHAALLGIPSHVIGYMIFGIFVGILVLFMFKRNIKKTTPLLLASVITSFSAFLLLPRMHERYFYPALLLLVPLAAYDIKLNRVFWALSFLHLINLYHFWWVPRIPLLIEIFSSGIFEKYIILLNIALFIYLFIIFKRVYAKK